MRRLILIAAVAIALGACGRSSQQETNEVTGENLTAESIGSSNDVTAIDAVTGDAANMAADVDMNYGNLEENGAPAVANKAATPATPRTKAPGKPPVETPAPAEPVTTNNSM
jgi:hypothetical protein